MAKRSTRAYPDLKTWRDAQGLSTYEAAELLRLSQSYYSKLERRTHATGGKRAKAIMQVTGVPLEVLVGAA